MEKLPCGRPIDHRNRVTKKEMDLLHERLKEFLLHNGLKYSEARWAVAEVALGSGAHLNAQELVSVVNQSHPSIGAATVYRSLKTLTDAKILRECLVSSRGGAVYESYEDEHHDHVVCADCGHILEFHEEKIESLQNQVLEKMKFKPLSHRHVLYAKCDFKK
jgi:Fur family transcriptional regulator, ferric uptake regulator